MRYQAILWDLDGTLLNTLDDLAASVNAALGAHKLPSRTVGEVCAFVGNGIRRLIEQAVPADSDDVTIESVLSDFKMHYAVHCQDTTAPYDGILPLLRRLKEAGVRSAVVSNKADFAVSKLVQDMFSDVVDVAVGQRDAIPKKPAPDMVNIALEMLGVTRDEVLYIGDSEVDVVTAEAAGLAGVFVTWGFRSREQLAAAGATVTVDSVEELISLLWK